MKDDDERGALGGMTDRGNRGALRNPAPMSLRPPQIPHDQARARPRTPRGGKAGTNRLSYGTA
jgi:hypothetical protein